MKGNEMTATLRDITPKSVKIKLKVLEPGETRRQKLWDECVAEARTLVTTYKNIRFDVVALMEKCCVMHHGGRAVGSRYTVTQFAKEVGIAKGTLMQWVRLKRVRASLPNPDKFSYEDLNQIDKDTERHRDPEKRAAALRKTAKTYATFSEETVKMRKYIKHLRSVHFNARHPKMLKGCDGEVIGEIVHLCREIVRLLAPLDKKTKAANE